MRAFTGSIRRRQVPVGSQASGFPLVNYLPVAPVHEPGCQLVNHVALVQLGSVDTEPMGAGCRKHTIHLDVTEEKPHRPGISLPGIVERGVGGVAYHGTSTGGISTPPERLRRGPESADQLDRIGAEASSAASSRFLRPDKPRDQPNDAEEH